MTLEQLRIFVTVARRMHVTRAAEELGITQSGASAAIAALEARYGLPLFHRVGRRIELTEAGQTFLPAAQAVIDQAATAAQSLTELSTLRRGTLSIFASQTVANYWLPTRLTEFRTNYADIKLRVQIGNTQQVAEAVVKGTADLGFAEEPVNEPILQEIEIPGDRLVLAFAASHPWAARRKIGLDELASVPWIMRESGSGTRQNFEETLRKLHVDPEALPIMLELPSSEAVLAAVESGAGVTVISELVIKGRGNLRSLDIGLEPRAFRILRHRERFQTAAQTAMLAITTTRREPAVEAGRTIAFPAKTIPFRRALG
jgi:DNA-binding transcriptional LysR family regulator